ncbi:MAG: uncharacterized membrane protein (DUF485 family) [Planctomycetota bacterium]|jgi:uncharacterized membrane protein (DUF485 family)
MQSDPIFRKLVNSPAFHALLAKKTRMIFFLSGLMLTVFSLYFFCLAYLPEWMGSALSPHTIISNGICLTVVCVVFSILISGFYIWWANNFHDNALQTLLQELSDTEE